MSSTPVRATGALAATVLTVLLALTVLGYTMLGQMACDACTGAALEAFEGRYWTAVVGVIVCVALAGGLLVAGRVLVRRGRARSATVLTWFAPVVTLIAWVLVLVLVRA